MIETYLSAYQVAASIGWAVSAALLIASWWVPFCGPVGAAVAALAATLTVREWLVRTCGLIRVVSDLGPREQDTTRLHSTR